MRPNTLYNLIVDGVINLAQLNIQAAEAKESSQGISYFLIPLLRALSGHRKRELQAHRLSKLDCQFEYKQEKYALIENHISIYSHMIDKEEKIPVLSCYHYTATYQNHAGVRIHIRMYFSSQGTVLSLGDAKHTFRASKDKVTIDDIPSSERLSIEKTANHFCAEPLSSVHMQWSNILCRLKDKISSKQLSVTELSKKIITPPSLPGDIAAYLQELQELIDLYDQYIAYSPSNQTEMAICKLLKQNKTVFKDRLNALERKSQKKKKKKIKTPAIEAPISPSFGQINEALQQASAPSKSKREQRLEILNHKIEAAQENKNPTERITQLHSLYQRKLDLLSADSTSDFFEIIGKLTRNRLALEAQLIVIAKYGDLISFNKLIGFFDEIGDRTIANFFFTLVTFGHTDLFDHALKTLKQFNANTQFLMQSESLLLKACRHDNNDKAYFLVSSLVESSNILLNIAVDLTGYTALHIAVIRNNVRLVKLLTAHGHAVDPIQQRPHLLSLGRGENGETIRKIHDYVTEEMSKMTITYRTPLQWACAYRYEEIIAILLPLNTNATHRDYRGFDCLGAYLYNSRSDRIITPCNEETIKKLCAKGCSLDDYQGENKAGATALFFAAQEGDIEVLKILLAMGANPNLRNENQGVSPTLMACNKKNLNIVTLLLDHPLTKISEEEFILCVYTTMQHKSFEITLLLLTKKMDYWKTIKTLCDEHYTEIHVYPEDDSSQIVNLILPEDPQAITLNMIAILSPLFLDLLAERVKQTCNTNCAQAQARAQNRTDYSAKVKTVYQTNSSPKNALRFIKQNCFSSPAIEHTQSDSPSSSSSGYY